MPGSVENAAPSTVLPLSLCTSFSHFREYAINENEYRNGESQRDKLTDTSRRRWRIGKRLSATDLGTLHTFYNNRKGPHEPFYFYDPWTYHDPTGVETTGRYVVRFNTPWNQSLVFGRLSTELELIELA